MALMFVAGGLLWANLTVIIRKGVSVNLYEEVTYFPYESYGWPYAWRIVREPELNDFVLIVDAAVAFVFFAATAFLCEWFARCWPDRVAAGGTDPSTQGT